MVGRGPAPARLALGLAVVLAGAVAAGCGGDPRDWEASDGMPAISSLVATAVAPAGPGWPATYQFEVRFEDPDADLPGGSCQLQSTTGFAELPLVAVATGPEAREGTVACLFDIPTLDRVVSGEFTVTDRVGHVSNALGFEIPAQPARQVEPDDRPGRVGGAGLRGVAASLRPARS